MTHHCAYLLMLLVAILLTGCDVHQWPEQHADIPNPTPDPTRVTMPLRLEYSPDVYFWEHKYDPLLGSVEEINPSLDIFPDYPGTSSKYTNLQTDGVLQIDVKVFPASDASRCVAEQTFTRQINGSYDSDLEIQLPDYGSYDIVVWTQLLTSADTSPFYNPSVFSQIHLIPANYRGNTDYRDAFRGRLRVDVASETMDRQVVYMKRPMGKFELVTTDLSEFLDRETEVRHLSSRASVTDYRVIISFPMWYPSSYSAMDDRLENASTGVSFETTMTVTGESEASLGFEYVLLGNNADGGVQTSVSVYRLDGTRVASSQVFTVPMRRDHHTLLRGAFLSMEGNGGVGIDPDFNGDHNVIW